MPPWSGRGSALERGGTSLRALWRGKAAWLIFAIATNALDTPAVAQPADRPTSACFQLETTRGWPQIDCISSDNYAADTCAALERNADRWRLPPDFFARLIWQESRFDPNAVSPAGAQGIAQFMPGTADMRGLENAFNPSEALARSAEYLRFLADRFGNLGLAAAAYNAGEGRISRFLSGQGYMPLETESYVRIVTGFPVALWASAPPEDPDFRLNQGQDFNAACLELASTREVPAFELEVQDFQPWGVEIASHFSSDVVQSMFERVRARYPEILSAEKPLVLVERNLRFGSALRYHARIGRSTREEALELCRTLSTAGGVCRVVEN